MLVQLVCCFLYILSIHIQAQRLRRLKHCQVGTFPNSVVKEQ